MKKKYFLILVIIFFLPTVNAGKTFELDFNTKDNYPLIMEKGDRVLFEYGGYNHTIILDEIKKNVLELDLFMFLEGELHTPNYIYLNEKYNIKLDFNKDGKKELEILYGNADPKNNKASITIRKLETWDENAKLEPFWKSEESSNNKLRYLLYAMGMVVILLLAFFFFIKNNRYKGIYY